MYLPTEAARRPDSGRGAPDGNNLAPTPPPMRHEPTIEGSARRPKRRKAKRPPSPFCPPPRHQFGEVDEDTLKNPILWLGENCHLRPKKNPRRSPAIPSPRCP